MNFAEIIDEHTETTETTLCSFQYYYTNNNEGNFKIIIVNGRCYYSSCVLFIFSWPALFVHLFSCCLVKGICDRRLFWGPNIYRGSLDGLACTKWRREARSEQTEARCEKEVIALYPPQARPVSAVHTLCHSPEWARYAVIVMGCR